MISMKEDWRIAHCAKCVTDRSLCKDCIDNPIYANYPVSSKFSAYVPTCPRGYIDCVCDPAYIKFFNPDWYKKLYGDLSPEDAAKQHCIPAFIKDPDEKYPCYDDEDK